jgi:serine protease Do
MKWSGMAGLVLAAVLLPACEGRTGQGPVRDQDVEVHSRVQQQLGDIPTQLDTASAVRLSAAFRAAAARALPAVVQISTIAMGEGSVQPFPSHPSIERQRQRTQGSGSGFIFDARGYILTNNHVVQNAVNVTVVMLDGREFTAEVVGTDPNTDVAVLRVTPTNAALPVIEFGDSEQLRVGDWVIALGNPLGLTFTATAGIVSAQGRDIGILQQTVGPTALEAFIQTDAAINPGNSGGPLVDLHGRVVGINTAIESATGFFTGAGFAIPITLARKVANDLLEYGVVHRPRLGIGIDNVSAADAEVYGLPAVSGVEVTSVTPGEAADRGGIQMGDVIVRVAGQPVATLTDLQTRVALHRPGERIDIAFIRYGRPLQTTVQLGEFAPAERRAVAEPVRRQPANPLGFAVAPLPQQLARQLGLQGEEIPVVTEVDRLGPAGGRGGIVRGDIVRRFNDREIRTIRDLERAAAGLRAGQVVSLVVVSATDQGSVPRIVNYRVQ